MTQREPTSSLPPLWLLPFFSILLRSPVRALAIVWWYGTRRKVRALHRLRDAATALLPVYKMWMRVYERREVRTLFAQEEVGSSTDCPRFSLLLHMPDWTDNKAVDRTIASVRDQFCGDWELIVTGEKAAMAAPHSREIYLGDTGLDTAIALNRAVSVARGAFCIVLPPDSVMPRWALARYRHASLEHPTSAVLYGDEDLIDATGRRSRPWFKPQWDEELILAQDYVSHACAIATPLARAVGPVPTDLSGCAGYALILAATAGPETVVNHVAHVLCHMSETGPGDDPAARLRAVAQWVAAAGASATPGPFGTVRVLWPLPSPAPSVTIIVPTRDHVALLEACVGSVLRETRYPNYNILVVDNGSVEPETIAWFARIVSDSRVSVAAYNHPYNYSAINNFAATLARGQYLCLLNNDTEIIDENWLDELIRYATRPGVGAVGAKLLYADRSIQHAGVVIGLGNAAGHAHRALPGDEPGYFAQAHVAHYSSAVTAACLVVERAKFDAVGGLDEIGLQIAYNDVDLCLKLEQAGWKNVYAPYSVVVHHESKSRDLDLSPGQIARYNRELAIFQKRWGTTNSVDRMHHPRLDRSSETYRIRL